MLLLYLISETYMLMCTAGLHVQVQPMWSIWYGMLHISDEGAFSVI